MANPILVAVPVYKHTEESKRLYFDFTHLIGDATLASGATVTETAENNVDEVDALSISSVSISGNRVNFTCAAGTSGENYCINGKVTDSTGQIHVIEGQLRVRDNC